LEQRPGIALIGFHASQVTDASRTVYEAEIATAKSTGSRVDEINTVSSDRRYEI
jgi:hypothetical protein